MREPVTASEDVRGVRPGGWLWLATGLLVLVVLGVLVLKVTRWQAGVRRLHVYTSAVTVTCSGPPWLISLIGQTPFQCAVTELRRQGGEDPLGDGQMQQFVGLLGRFPSLRYLDIAGADIGDDGVAELARLPQLRHLSLGGTRVTDEGLEHLRALTQLRQLSLEETAVTDAGMAVIAGLPSLQSINLERTQVTDAGTRLLGDRPGLVIEITDD